MTASLHLPARPDVPIACDLSMAEDTAKERLAEYARLFDDALLRRSRADDHVVLAFRGDPGVRERVDSLARREAACCPFAGYLVETVGGEVIWTITTSRAPELLGAFYAEASVPA